MKLKITPIQNAAKSAPLLATARDVTRCKTARHMSYNMEAPELLPKPKRNKCYKYCFMPKCVNTSINQPDKMFVTVPKGKIRKKWMKITRRDPNCTSLITRFHCCEDHFKVNIIQSLLCIIL